MRDTSSSAGSPPAAGSSAESPLTQQSPILTKILENLPIALFAKNVQDNYRMIMWNARAEELFGIPREALLGKTDYDMFPQNEADHFRRTDEQVMRSGMVVDIPEEPITTARGTWAAHTVKVPIYDEHGRPSILFGLVEDITVQKEAEANQLAKIEAERANRAKSEFLANMSHELRTPLNSLLGMATLFRDTKLDGGQRGMLEAMSQAGEMLLKTVDDVLDFSKIEAGQVALERIGFDLKTVFVQVVTVLQPMASKKGLALTLDWPKMPMPAVVGDPLRIARVLHNLVGNAIKYTPQGRIGVAVQWEVAGARLDFTCRVTDTGIGIAAQNHGTIFQKFNQADSSTTRKYGGTGLGLSITQQLVEMMGGTIGVNSRLGEGASFWFSIPFPTTGQLDEEWADSGPQAAPARDLPAPAEVRLLVAEDNALNRLYMEKLLEAFGFRQVRFVPNGAEAVRAYAETCPDLIFMDCHMPEKNGYEATQDIRALEEASGGHVPIIAMTANALSGEREKCLSFGMDEYISKPVDLNQFKSVLGAWVSMPDKPSLQGSHRPESAESAPPVDMAEVRLYSLGNRDKEKFLVGIFIEQAEQVVTALRKHAPEPNSKEWYEAAHLMKGTAGNLGAAQLHVLCSRAQRAATETASFRHDLLNEIEHEIGRINRFFDDMGLMPAAA
jgi:PAS domain S-box-containing protein